MFIFLLVFICISTRWKIVAMWIYQANPSTSTADSHQVNSAYGQDRIESGPRFRLRSKDSIRGPVFRSNSP